MTRRETNLRNALPRERTIDEVLDAREIAHIIRGRDLHQHPQPEPERRLAPGQPCVCLEPWWIPLTQEWRDRPDSESHTHMADPGCPWCHGTGRIQGWREPPKGRIFREGGEEWMRIEPEEMPDDRAPHEADGTPPSQRPGQRDLDTAMRFYSQTYGFGLR